MRLLAGPVEGARAVTVTTLEMRDPGGLRPARDIPGVRWFPVVDGKASISADMYARVGAPWGWVDRRDWTPAQWSAWADRPGHHLGLLVIDGPTGPLTVGYAELDEQAGGDVEIAYLGLLPAFHGRGLGSWLLAEAIRRAWELPGTRRVWVHTCDLDGPTALANYRSRGMVETGREVEWRWPDPADAALARAMHPMPAAPRTDAFAALSLTAGVLSVTVGGLLWFLPVLPIAAILLGTLARPRIDRNGTRGRGLATAGIVTGYVGLGIVLVVLVLAAVGTFAPGPVP